jgi:hypothetical protein
MIKFLKTVDNEYYPAASLLAIDVAAGSDDAQLYFPSKLGDADEAKVVVDGGADNLGYAIAEAIIEEINFGKVPVIDLMTIHPSVTDTTTTDS